MAISHRICISFRPPDWMRNWLLVEKKNQQASSMSETLENIVAAHIRGDHPTDQMKEKLEDLESKLTTLQHHLQLMAQAMIVNARTTKQRDLHQILRDVTEG